MTKDFFCCSSDEEISASLDGNFNCEEELDYSDDYEVNININEINVSVGIRSYMYVGSSKLPGNQIL